MNVWVTAEYFSIRRFNIIPMHVINRQKPIKQISKVPPGTSDTRSTKPGLDFQIHTGTKIQSGLSREKWKPGLDRTDPAIERSGDRAIERSSDRATERSSDRAIERPCDRATVRPSDRATEPPIDRATERPRDRAPERPSDRGSDRGSDRATEDNHNSSCRRPFETLTNALCSIFQNQEF